MKKTICMLAVCAASSCMAQTQSNITVYGVIDLDLVRDDNGTAPVTRMDAGILNGSRLGFKGVEDLGGGLSAIFQLENGFTGDTGAQADAQRLFNRLAFVGVNGAWGSVKLGRQNNPVYTTLTSWDPFAIGMAGDSSRLFSYNGSRGDNLVSYSFNTGPFRGELQYGVGEVAGNAAANRVRAGWGGYSKGALDVVATYQNIRNATDTAETRMVLLGGNYNFGLLKAFLTYAEEKGVILGTSKPLDQRDALIGVRIPVSAAGTVITSWIRKTDHALLNGGANQYAIGYRHDLSKRTTLYTSIGALRNDAAALYKVVAAGKTDKLINAGIRHIF
ncbi:porin [Duganella sp. LjRoot269]|uniref:porin n=1 Tax=Duganella sp. LjRoot269 TaxID=3342305 RepID=UPI003ECEF0F7